jgi:probable HAF family extracellular repeat protein
MQVVSMFSVPLERWYVMTKACCTAVLILGVLVAAPSAQAQTKKVSYGFADLGVLSSISPSSSAIRISSPMDKDNVRVVGYSKNQNGNNHAVIWERVNDQWVIRDLGTVEPEFENYYCYGISDLGQAVGWGINTQAYVAFFYDDVTGMESLTPADRYSSQAWDISNSYQVVGNTRTIDSVSQAYLWEPDGSGQWVTTDLGVLAGHYRSYAMAINNHGQIAGYSNPDSSTSLNVPAFWENVSGSWEYVNLNDAIGESGSFTPRDINDMGQIVGTHFTDGTNYAVLWQCVNGQWTLTDLSASKPSNFTTTAAGDINNLGQVVGGATLTTGENVGFLFRDGVMYNLSNFLPTSASGWKLAGQGINDYGQIVGRGTNPAGETRAFLMDTRAVTYSYTSTGSAVSIKDNASASKAMTLTDNVTITDLNVKVTLSHTRYADLKIELIGPNNVARVLCNAGAVTGSGTKTLVFDDEGAVGTIKPFQPLSYYDLTSTLGKWTLKISDTVKNSKTGSFTSFTLDVVPGL